MEGANRVREGRTGSTTENLLLYVCHQFGLRRESSNSSVFLLIQGLVCYYSIHIHTYVSQLNLHCRTSSSAYLSSVSLSRFVRVYDFLLSFTVVSHCYYCCCRVISFVHIPFVVGEVMRGSESGSGQSQMPLLSVG